MAEGPTTRALLGELAEQGVLVRCRRGRLVVDAPGGTPADLLRRLGEAETTVVEEIQARSGLPGPRPPRHAPAEFGLTDLQSAYQIGEEDYPELRTAAHVAHGFEVPDLDLGRLRAAVRAVLARHEMLRARAGPSGRRQQVMPADPAWVPEMVDWRDLDRDRARAAFERERETAARWLPALTEGPQLACVVYRARDSWFVLLCLRLFVLDARAIGVVSRDLAAAYAGGDLGPSPTGAFARYATAVTAHRDSQAYRNAVAHWRRRLWDLPGPPELPVLGRPEVAAFARIRHRLPAPAWSSLRQRAAAGGLSANSVLCAAYADVLRRWSGNDRFVLTALVSTRALLVSGEPLWQECVGNFGSTLLLECADVADGGFRARALALQRRMMDDLPHCWLSGVEVARRSRTGAATVASPFVFASGLDDGGSLPPHLGAHGWELVFKAMQTPQVLLDHQVSEEDGELVCTFDHVPAAFPDGMVAEVAAAHADLLRRLAGDDTSWSDRDPPPLPADLLAGRTAANQTARVFPPGGVLDGLATGADATAFLGADAELSYGAAAAIVRAMAAGIRRAAPGELVGVLARKSIGQYLAALAVVASGRAYVPLSVDWPSARIRHLLAGHGIGHVLADAAGAGLLPGVGLPVTWDPIDLDPAGDDGTPLPAPEPGALAYVIFTSGSTGTPKGVEIPHSGLRNTVCDMVERFGLRSDDRLLSLSELHFDLSAFDLFGALHCGGAVIVPPGGPVPDPDLWEQWLLRSGATVWNTVPALLEMLLDHLGDRAADVLSGLRLVLLSGDWVPLDLPDRVRRASPKALVVALGGATEASIWSNAHVLDTVDPAWKSVPYGKPLANQRYHVLDESFADRPAWVPGELYIAGTGVAAGYHRQPELTARRFPRHPVTGERLYRTGDSGRYWPDGTLEFLGRRDSQAKVRGYRVDLLEVEQHLLGQASVRAAACVVTGTGAASCLVACCVPEDGVHLDPAALRESLAAVLPRYAVPSAFRVVPALPLTPNGKRDAAALRALAEGADTPAAERRPPATPRERTVAALWREVCGMPVQSVDQDFFATGGTSVAAVRLLRLIERECGVRLSLSSLFEASTVAAQAMMLDEHRERALVTVRPGGGEPIVLVHPVGGHLLGYRDLAAALPARFTVHGLQSPPAARLPATLAELAGRYTAALSALPGPPHLLGWSMGGVLAAEIALRLVAAGCPPRSLTVVDSYVGVPGASGLDDQAMAAGFIRDFLGDAYPADGVAEVPPGEPDPFGYLAPRYLPDHSVAALREFYAEYRALYRLLLTHPARPLPRLPHTTVVVAAGRQASAFPGLLPIRDHPGHLVPAGAVCAVVPEDHYSVVRAPGVHSLMRLLPEGSHAPQEGQ